MLRTICSVVSVSLLLSCDRPLASPKAKPMPPPMTKPMLARQKLTQMLRTSSPDSSSFQPASATSVGAGNTRAGTRPADAGGLPDQHDGQRHDPLDQAVGMRQSRSVGCAEGSRSGS